MGFRPLDSPFFISTTFFDFFSCFMYLEASHRGGEFFSLTRTILVACIWGGFFFSRYHI